MEELKEMVSERGNPMILHENFKFYKCKRLKNNEIMWRCSKRTCTVKLYTIDCEHAVLRKAGQHNHDTDLRKLSRQICSTAAKRKAVEDISAKPSKIFHSVASNLPTDNLEIRDIACIKENVYNARRKMFPALPKSQVEVHSAINSINLVTNRMEQFVLENDIENKIIIFTCVTNLKFLCSLETIYMDGTFQYCTKFFHQLFTIHGVKNNFYVPLVFCLLPSKTTAIYEKAFKMICKKCVDNDFNFNPRNVVVDFESAIHSAVVNTWEFATLIGCRFHLAQAWWRKIQNLGLATAYKERDSDIGKWLRTIFGCMYLDPQEVGDFFANELAENQPRNEQVQLFADYLVDIYISEEAIFPPHIWAAMTASESRTTNGCESFHSKFNASFYSNHPSIFIFVQRLLEIQTETYIKMQSLLAAKKKQNVKTKNKELLDKRIALYKSNEITRLQYVKYASHIYENVF